MTESNGWPRLWWQSAAIYELYVQSFADSDGDGIGDLAGVRARLPYLAELGIDAIWYSPWYPSPRSDAGYDVADYRSIDPAFGTLADADALIAEGHRHGIRTIIDIVPNHCSDQHRWFAAALAAPPGSAERARFWFRPGRGEHGDLPPNDWQSIFGGPAWTRTTAPDGTPGEWYLHLFAPEQPDFNWGNPEVRAEFEDILRFWFDRGVDGIRIDSAALLTKDPALPETAPGRPVALHRPRRRARHLPGLAPVADQYPGRVLIGEIWLPDATRMARYLHPDELHTVFNFPYLCCPWDAASLREVIDGTLAFHAAAGAPATWVLSNHDVDRHVSRYGRADTSFALDRRDHSQPVDLALGTRRARAAALLTMALPGSVYLYQGEELGLWEVEDLPAAKRQDPIWHRTNGADPGRDGSRVPLPWSGTEPPFGFSPPAARKEPWLPQPQAWHSLTVQAESADPASMLTLYRQALHLRRTEFPADTPMTWLPAPAGVLSFTRGHIACVANLSPSPVALPAGDLLLTSTPLLTSTSLPDSTPLPDSTIPPDTTIWLRLPAS